MSRSRIVIAMAGVLAAGSLCVGGCGGPPGAGTVNMTAIKAVASQRGLPETKGRAARAGSDKSPGPARPTTPARPNPQGRR
jgi:hypothetical protein